MLLGEMSDAPPRIERVVLVEEQSAETALRRILPPMLAGRATHQFMTFRGKRDLLGKLDSRLRGLASWISNDVGRDIRVLVLVDRDDDDCRRLKAQLESTALAAGLATSATATAGSPVLVVNRIVVEELEAWYFGDVDALCEAYPGVPPTLASRSAFRDPDAIRGGTWEALERVLRRAGHHRGGLQKVRVGRPTTLPRAWTPRATDRGASQLSVQV